MYEWKLDICRAFRHQTTPDLKHENLRDLNSEQKRILNREKKDKAETDTALENKPESKMLNLGRLCIASNVMLDGLASCVWSQAGWCGEGD